MRSVYGLFFETTTDGEGRRSDLGDRREILEGVVGQAGVDELVERVTARHQDQRVAIRGRLRKRLRGNDAAGARTVINDGLLAPDLCQRLAERAREYVHRTTRGIRHQDVDRLARKIFRMGADAGQEQRRSREQTADLLAHAHHPRSLHLVLLLLRLIGVTGSCRGRIARQSERRAS